MQLGQYCPKHFSQSIGLSGKALAYFYGARFHDKVMMLCVVYCYVEFSPIMLELSKHRNQEYWDWQWPWGGELLSTDWAGVREEQHGIMWTIISSPRQPGPQSGQWQWRIECDDNCSEIIFSSGLKNNFFTASAVSLSTKYVLSLKNPVS